MSFEGARQEALWNRIENYTPWFLERHQGGAMVRVSCTLRGLQEVMASFDGAALARAGTGVCYGYFERTDAAVAWLAGAALRGLKAVMEFAPEERKRALDLWRGPCGDLDLMRRIKGLFDPMNLLNRGRLYGRI
jgi:FAD/FMN-containing dehydrogenase